MFILSLAACRYEDGPKISLRSVKARLTNTWVVHHIYKDGVDKTSDFNAYFPNYKLVIKDDNNYVLSFEGFFGSTENGTWSLNDEKTELNLKKDGTGTNKWKIKRLTHTEFWAEQFNPSDSTTAEYQLIAD